MKTGLGSSFGYMAETARARVREVQVESRSGHVMQARRSRSAIGLMILLLAALIPLSVPSASAKSSAVAQVRLNSFSSVRTTKRR